MVRETYRPPPWSGRDGWHTVVPGAYRVTPSYTETYDVASPSFSSSSKWASKEAPGPAGFLGRVKALTKEAARDQRVSWDEYFGGMALLAAARSPCERLHVGCVVVRDRRVLSMGYNGFFQGAPHQSIMAHGHEQATVHAEQNAIAHAARVGISLGGGCAYVTHYPCVNCFKSLVAAGIRKVHYIDDYRNDPVCVELSEVSGVAIERLGGANK